jgi:hypothetical protein
MVNVVTESAMSVMALAKSRISAAFSRTSLAYVPDVNDYLKDAAAKMNKLGQEGWELVTASQDDSNSISLFFKRSLK